MADNLIKPSFWGGDKTGVWIRIVDGNIQMIPAKGNCTTLHPQDAHALGEALVKIADIITQLDNIK